MAPYLHLMDDTIFANSVIDLFELCAPGQNRYCVEIPEGHGIKNIREPWRVTPITGELHPALTSNGDLRAVFLHALTGSRMNAITELPEHIRVFWFSWGFDLYPRCWKRSKLYLPETLRYQRKRIFEGGAVLPHVAGKIARTIRNALMPKRYPRLMDIISRIDYCSTIVPPEFSIAQTLPGFSAKQVYFHYGWLESLIDHEEDHRIEGNNILIANSNSRTSNHVDAFKKLADSEIKNYSILVPLSYGSDLKYKKFVIESGYYFFGSNFVPILDFMPLDKYISLLKSCGTAIFNHNRQQALGNVLIMKWLGANVYLNRVNPIYSHFKKLGIDVIDFSGAFDGHPLPANEKLMDDRHLLTEEYGIRSVRARLMKIIDLCS